MPTINDIAKAAGVSHGTVSNVLNKTGKVSTEKIKLVEDAIKRLGYVPNVQAKKLRQGDADSFAVILPSLKEEKYLSLFTAIQLNLSMSDHDLFVYQTEDIAAEEEGIIDSLRVSGLAAIIVVSCLDEKCLEKYRRLPAQIIYIERRPQQLQPNECFLAFDPDQISREMISHCTARHWRSLLYFGAEIHSDSTDLLLNRLKKASQAADIRIRTVAADYKLALNQAFEVAQQSEGYDAILTQSSVCTHALNTAFQILHIEQHPPVLAVGDSSSGISAAAKTYQLDYGSLGLRVVKMLRNLLNGSEISPREDLLSPKGFPWQLPIIEKMSGEEITMLTLDNPSTKALRCLLPEFEHYSGVRVKLIAIPYDDLHAQLDLIGPHFTYDLIRLDVAKFDNYGRRIFLPFEEIPLLPDELSPRLIKSGYDNYSLLNGRRYALPLDPSVQIFLYRSDLFSDATIRRAYYERFHESLTIPKTFEQYLHIAEFFTRQYNPNSPTMYGATMTCGSASVIASDFLPYYLSKADHPQIKKGQIQLDCPEMVAAIRQYQQMENYASKQQWWSDSIQQFARGTVATTVIYSNYAATLIDSANSKVVGKVGAAVIPGQKPLLGGGIVGISRYSHKVAACKQFFNWYYSADVAALLVRLGGTSPIVDAYEDFQNYSTFPWMNTSKESFGLGQRGLKEPIPRGYSIQKYEFAIGSAVRNVLEGLMNAEEASAMAQAMYHATEST